MRSVLFAIVISVFSITGCINQVNEPPFKAKVISVLPKIDGSGYALVLRAVDDPNNWLAAKVSEFIRKDEIVTVDRSQGKIFYQNNKEGLIINKENNSGYILPK